MRNQLKIAAVLLAFLAPCVHAQTPGTGVATGSGSTTCVLTVSVTAGGGILAEISTTSTSATLSISDSNVTWTQVTGSPWTDSGTNDKTAIWTGVVTSTASDTVTLSMSSNPEWATCAAIPFTGQAASSMVDKVAQASNAAIGSGSNQVSGTTSTTSQATELLIGVYGILASANTNPTWTAGSGYTLSASYAVNVSSFNSATAIEYKNVTSTGAYQSVITNNTTSSGSGIIVTIKAAGGAAAAPRLPLLGVGP